MVGRVDRADDEARPPKGAKRAKRAKGAAPTKASTVRAQFAPNWSGHGVPGAGKDRSEIRVLRQPADIPSSGRFAVVSDPFGAAFGIFSPGPNAPLPSDTPAVGDFSWFELYTPDPEGAWRFYASVFGWEKTSAMDMGEMGVYQMFGRGGGVPRGGIMKPPPGAPAAWMPYALVKDAKAAAAAAQSRGATIVNGPMEVPGGDWIAQGMDPQGAMFSVHSLKRATPAPNARKAAAKAAKPAAKPMKRATAKKSAKKAAAARKTAARKAGAAKGSAKKKTVAKKKAIKLRKK